MSGSQIPSIIGKEGDRLLFIIPKRFLMKRRPLVLLSAGISWSTSPERSGGVGGSSAALCNKGKESGAPSSKHRGRVGR